MNPFTPNRWLSNFVLQGLPPNSVIEFACTCLEDGYDSPSLRRLASFAYASDSDPYDLFVDTIAELGLMLPTKEEAAIFVARAIAEDIIAGKLRPYDGAKSIWRDVFVRVPNLKPLSVFVALASEIEDDPKHQVEYENDILMHAERFLHSTSP